jgi:hypothetical protein
MATPTTLPATFVAGNVLTAAQMNDLRGAFRVLQVVSANQNAQANNSTSTYADTGLSATITPSSTSSKILVLVNQAGFAKGGVNTASCVDVILLRGATNITQFVSAAGYTNSTADNYVGNSSCMYLDSPATTSATTYKTQFRNQMNVAGVTVQVGNSVSNIVLLEISA